MLRPKSEIEPRYLLELINSENVKNQFNSRLQGIGVPNLHLKEIKEVEIPLPPLSVQQQIVAKIENYQAIINGAKQVIENYKPQIDINPDWEMVELGEVATFKNGINFTKESEGSITRILGVRDFKNNLYAPIQSFDSVQIDGSLDENYKLKKGDIVFVRSNGNQDLIGRCVLIPELDFSATFSGFTIRLRFTSNAFNPKFFIYLFKSDNLRKQLIDSGTGANIKSLNQTALYNLHIPLPPLSEQRQIVRRIEEEQDLVNGNKKLVALYEQKIKDEINKLWEKEPVEYVTEEGFSVAAEGVNKKLSEKPGC